MKRQKTSDFRRKGVRIASLSVFAIGVLLYASGLVGLLLEEQSHCIGYTTHVTLDILKQALADVGNRRIIETFGETSAMDFFIIAVAFLATFLPFLKIPLYHHHIPRIIMTITPIVILAPFGLYGLLSIVYAVTSVFRGIHFLDGEFLGEGYLCIWSYLAFSVAALLSAIGVVRSNNSSDEKMTE